MYTMHYVKETVQQTADAIAEVLNIDVVIADINLTRVAGTGNNKEQWWETMRSGLVYKHVLKTGQPMVIENPGLHEICQDCLSYGNCIKVSEVVSPIKIEGKTIGVIGLVNFDFENGKDLLEHPQSLLRFLDRMADLIAGKVLEYQRGQERIRFFNQFMTVVNILDDSICLIDNEKKITMFNKWAENFLGIKPTDTVFLDEIIELDNFWEAIQNGIPYSGQVKGKRRQTFFVDVFPIVTADEFEGAVVIVKDIEKVKKIVQDVTGNDVDTNFSEILGNSPRLGELKKLALRIARGGSTVLIQGESGTGKELFARAIHQASDRKIFPFIAINCGAIPENLLESELFGYDEGAFTGAKKGGKIGKFELANRGTLFLDEIGDMSLHLQIKLLRVLQEKCLERVGGNNSIPINVRIIAATNRNLEKMIEMGEFREDLFYRLNVIPIVIPPLRERKEDLLVLTQFYLKRYCQLFGREEIKIKAEAFQLLLNYPWPGNVRELSNVIEYSVNVATGEHITISDLPVRLKTPPLVQQKDIKDIKDIKNLKILERETIIKVLHETGDNTEGKENAATILGIGIATLYRKIREYNIKSESKYF